MILWISRRSCALLKRSQWCFVSKKILRHYQTDIIFFLEKLAFYPWGRFNFLWDVVSIFNARDWLFSLKLKLARECFYFCDCNFFTCFLNLRLRKLHFCGILFFQEICYCRVMWYICKFKSSRLCKLMYTYKWDENCCIIEDGFLWNFTKGIF